MNPVKVTVHQLLQHEYRKFVSRYYFTKTLLYFYFFFKTRHSIITTNLKTWKKTYFETFTTRAILANVNGSMTGKSIIYLQCSCCSSPKSRVTSSPMSTNGAQYLTPVKFSDSRRHFIAWLRETPALFPELR